MTSVDLQTKEPGSFPENGETPKLSGIAPCDSAGIRQDDNKNKICAFEGGGFGGREENRPKTLFFLERHDNKILKVQILFLRNFVVIAQVPRFGWDSDRIQISGTKKRGF